MSDRGEYRSFFVSILDDLEFQAMDGLVFKLLFALKMSLGPAGIGILRKLDLVEKLGCSLDELESSLATLEAPKPGETHGWILRERNIVWLINGLRHELGISRNSANHRKMIVRQLKPLGDKPIVRKFVSYYREWFDASSPQPPTIDRGQEGADEGSKGGREGVADHTKREAKRPSDHPETHPATSDSDRRLLNRFYRNSTPARIAEVEGQLADALSAQGARVRKGEYVKARSRAHLDRCIEETIAQGVKDPDKAIVVVLRKLGDPEKDSNGDYPIEAARKADKADEELAKEYKRQRWEFSVDWGKDHPDEMTEFQELATAELGSDSDVPGYEQLHRMFVSQKVAEAAGFPSYEEWLAQREVTAA
jgi:hypothetical protein